MPEASCPGAGDCRLTREVPSPPVMVTEAAVWCRHPSSPQPASSISLQLTDSFLWNIPFIMISHFAQKPEMFPLCLLCWEWKRRERIDLWRWAPCPILLMRKLKPIDLPRVTWEVRWLRPRLGFLPCDPLLSSDSQTPIGPSCWHPYCSPRAVPILRGLIPTGAHKYALVGADATIWVAKIVPLSFCAQGNCLLSLQGWI